MTSKEKVGMNCIYLRKVSEAGSAGERCLEPCWESCEGGISG